MVSKRFARVSMWVAGAIFGMTATLAHAQPAKRTLNALALPSYPPFEFRDEKTGKMAGFNIDLLDAMAARMNSEVAWTDTSFANMISFAPLRTKRADIILGTMGDTPERQASVTFVDFVYSNQVVYTTV